MSFSRPKYIVFDMGTLDVAVVFPELVEHSRVANSFQGWKPVGAGFFQVGVNPKTNRHFVNCYGKSVTLGLESRGKEDAREVARTILGLVDPDEVEFD